MLINGLHLFWDTLYETKLSWVTRPLTQKHNDLQAHLIDQIVQVISSILIVEPNP